MDTNNKGTILIIDDDKFLLDMYAIKFGEHGFKVEIAFSGNEALEKFKEGVKPDIALVDIIMPGMSGFELIEKMKEDDCCKDATIIVLSNLGQKEDIEKGLEVGADGYIVKASATPSEVVTKVLDIVANKK